MPRQTTIAEPRTVRGVGLHTGELTTLRFLPAEANAGVRFRRTDLPGAPEIPACITTVINTQRSTSLGSGGVIVQTVEHILATVQCLGIDNLIIEVDAPETPLTDGSCKQFAEALIAAGTVAQEAEQQFVSLDRPIAIEGEGMTLCALPADDYRISYTMSYPHPVLPPQFREFAISRHAFLDGLATARTFALYSELEQLLRAGLIKGGSLDNAVVITDQAILSNNGLRFPDEFVRHKITDLIGDLALIGRRLKAHIVSIRSGHTLNTTLARAIASACGLV